MWSHPLLSCALIVVAVASIRRFIRESYSVDDLAQKHVFISGCDSGFGNLLARQLDARGLHVLAGCLTERGASALKAAASPRLKTLLLDVTDSASVGRAVALVSAEVGERGEPGGLQGADADRVPARGRHWWR